MDDSSKISKSVNKFAVEIYQELLQNGMKAGGNLIFSPLSVFAVLSMTSLGSAGNTADELTKVLHIADVDEATFARKGAHFSFKELKEHLDSSQNYHLEFTLSSRLYANTGSSILQEFISDIEECYRSGFEVVNQFNDSVIDGINDWIKEQTAGKIPCLLSQDIGQLDSLVLVNALYFKGIWLDGFHRSDTEQEFFKVPRDDKQVRVSFLKKKFELRVYNDRKNSCAVLELPFINGQFSMIVVLPHSDDGLDAMEKLVSADMLESWISNLDSRDVNLWLPKFRLEEQFSLTETLSSLGICDAFKPGAANFERMTGDRLMYISAVEHKAFIDVNEDGCEAAAGTSFKLVALGLGDFPPTGPVKIRVDHPFLFLIRDRDSSVILLMGRVTDLPHEERQKRCKCM